MTVNYGSTPTQLCTSTLTASGGFAATYSCSLTASQLNVGTYTSVDAVYAAGTSSNGNYSYNTSTSTPTQSFSVTPLAENTSTSLNSVTSSVTYGSETTETFSGTVTGVSGDGNPQGTVTVNYGSTPTQLCTSTLTASGGFAATYSCSLTASQLNAGTYTSVDAVYAAGTSSNGNYSYNTSTSTPTQSFSVTPLAENTSTSLNSVTSSVTYGSETTETFSGTVTGVSGDGNPQGTVTVNYGSTPTQLCTSTLTASGGFAATYSCSLTASQLNAGTYTSVDAVYAVGTSSNGNYSYTRPPRRRRRASR